jgi:hypothetical protein
LLFFRVRGFILAYSVYSPVKPIFFLKVSGDNING